MQKYLHMSFFCPNFALGFKKESQLKHNLQTLKNFSIMKTAKNYTSFAEYKNTKAEYETKREEAIKLMGNEARQAWAEIKAMEDTLSAMYDTLMPEVGMPCTMNLYSDRRAMTIIEVINANTIVVAENKHKCIDYFANEYEVLDEVDPRMNTTIFSRRKNGSWIEKGQPLSWGSVSLTLGYRVHSIDPSF